MITITFPDGTTIKKKEGVTGLELTKEISEGLAREAVAIRVNGIVLDLSISLKNDASIEILKFDSPDGLEVFRHSSTHLMAQAIVELFPEAKLTIGPVVEEGFYYDVDHAPFTEEDVERIESRMKEIIKRKLECQRHVLTKKVALDRFKDNHYKVEMIELMEGEITAYSQGDFIDLCRGPHVQHTGQIKAIKILKLAGAYWRGDAKNKQLQRLYGISFPDKKLLQAHLLMLEEAKKRDHKKIGREQKLFMIDDLIGKGLPVWLPKGELVKSLIEGYAKEMEEKYGYVRVSSPHVAKQELFLKSGHLPHYEETMYPKMTMDDGIYFLKAMNCPLHHLTIPHLVSSYRDLPIRLAEYGTVYRNELSGALSGLLRVRMLSMNDAHIYCTREQIGNEVKAVIQLIEEYYKVFGFTDYYYRLSLGDQNNKEKYIDEPENWDYAEQALRTILQDLKVEFKEAQDEAAFYGPKIDIQFKTVTGREESMSTVQLDFAAKSRFDFRFTTEKGGESNEVFVIHRAPLSTHERFMAFLIEHYAGKFPLWLSPVQVILLPIADRHKVYCTAVAEKMRVAGIRVEVDDKAETTGKKVRNAQLQHINYMLVVGDKELDSNTVNVRTREEKVLGAKDVDKFLQELVKEVQDKK